MDVQVHHHYNQLIQIQIKTMKKTMLMKEENAQDWSKTTKDNYIMHLKPVIWWNILDIEKDQMVHMLQCMLVN